MRNGRPSRKFLVGINAVLALWFAGVWALALAHNRPAYDLDRVEHIEHFVGAEGARVLLAAQGLVVTCQRFDQFFEAYLRSPMPVFITADSAWQTYHSLLEEGLRRLDHRQAAQLEEFSERLVAAIASAGPADEPTRQELLVFAAVGLGLQNPDALSRADGLYGQVRADAARLIQQLREGRGWVQLPFLGLPIDAWRFPGGAYYSAETELRGYYAARQWYSLCHFRATPDGERESACALRLVLTVAGDQKLRKLYEELTRPGEAVFGPPDGCGVSKYLAVAEKVFPKNPRPQDLADGLAAFRQAVARLPGPKVNDSFILPEDYALLPRGLPGFRLLPPARLPSAGLFPKLVNPHVRKRSFPTGVDFFAVGPLRSKAARDIVLGFPGRYPEEILEAGSYRLPHSLHGQALGLLTRLQEPLPRSMPSPLRSDAWKDKQLWTQLGAWATLQHMPVRPNRGRVVNPVAAGDGPQSGYVSPYPDFFCELGELARATGDFLARECGAAPPNVPALLVDLAELCDGLAAIAHKELAGQSLDRADEDLIARYGLALARLHVRAAGADGGDPFGSAGQAFDVRDDGPIVSPVFINPYENRTMYAALSKPEAIYVILRVGRRMILHRGAVMSYREFRRPSDMLINDDAWTDQVNAAGGSAAARSRSAGLPAPPSFAASFRKADRRLEPPR